MQAVMPTWEIGKRARNTVNHGWAGEWVGRKGRGVNSTISIYLPRSGLGELHYVNGDVFTGQWSNDFACGCV